MSFDSPTYAQAAVKIFISRASTAYSSLIRQAGVQIHHRLKA